MISDFIAPSMLRQPIIKAIRNKFVRFVAPAVLMMPLYIWVFDIDYYGAPF